MKLNYRYFPVLARTPVPMDTTYTRKGRLVTQPQSWTALQCILGQAGSSSGPRG